MPVVSLLERLFDYLCFTQLSAWSPNEAWFVTTSFFTDQAADEVSDLTHLRRMVLVDGQKLVNFIHQHWESLPSKWQWRLTECMVESDRQHRGG